MDGFALSWNIYEGYLVFLNLSVHSYEVFYWRKGNNCFQPEAFFFLLKMTCDVMFTMSTQCEFVLDFCHLYLANWEILWKVMELSRFCNTHLSATRMLYSYDRAKFRATGVQTWLALFFYVMFLFLLNGKCCGIQIVSCFVSRL